MSLYLLTIIGTIIGPFFLSFDKKVAFFKYWRYLIPAILIIAVPFIIWDELFTYLKIWGFNERYINGIYLGLLPIEEVLFFIIIPYACLFIYEVLKAYFPNFKMQKFAHFFAFTFVLSGFIFGTLHFDKWYTVSACYATSILTIGLYFIQRKSWFKDFCFTYIIGMIPFLVVNGILTGSFTDEPIVWYSDDHIIGWRIFTIPFEDLYYNYMLLLPIVAVYEYLKALYPRNK